ncbi:hypothetical protein ACA910_018108 [Epithemia clementina (nom. ined.)]
MKDADPFQTKIISVDDCISDEKAAAVKFHIENHADGSMKPYGRGSAFFAFNSDGLIQKVFWVQETSNKSGEIGLKVLRGVSKILSLYGSDQTVKTTSYESYGSKENDTPECAPVEYFASWSRRDIDAATELFDEEVTYDDTAFPNAFSGKDAVKRHLNLCAECFPETFTFELDEVINAGDTVCGLWHVENRGQQLPFTRGCSFYKINKKGKIQDGIDFVEPAVFKSGGVELFVDALSGKVAQEPARLIPLVVWIAYIPIVFFSDGILPGVNALALEQRTWEEVKDLSLNFFLVAPFLNLPFSPVVHPMLEGVFNLLLSWAAMFAGFLSDDRKDKPNLFEMVPMVIGMQFLTSAFLLPYFVIRSSEKRNDVSVSDLSGLAKACESPALGIIMGAIGSFSIAWAFVGRELEFGGLNERLKSFSDLLSIDRVGSSFLVDLIIFGLFQFWLIDDDMKRRGVASGENVVLTSIAKVVPFFGMAAYLALRPRFPHSADKF